MGTIREPEQAKLFAGIIAASQAEADKAVEELKKSCGKVDLKSPAIDFKFTDYYSAEMGRELIRFWVSFENLIDPAVVARVKRESNRIESLFGQPGKRRVNIDPGYITPAKVVLASSKDYSHRIYLGEGIYAEVTLIYRHKVFTALEWTYPDYQSKPAHEFFLEARKIHQIQLKAGGKPGDSRRTEIL